MADDGKRAILELVRDIGGDEMAASIRSRIEGPLETTEQIGFYGMSKQPLLVRMYCAAVSALEDTPAVIAVEDKYSGELFDQWVQEGWIDLEQVGEDARALIQGVLAGSLREWAYAKGAAQIEAYLKTRGRALLSLDPTGGDTMFFAVVSLEVADRWRNVGFGKNDSGEWVGVRQPMWGRLWGHLCYAYGLDPRTAVPEGTVVAPEELEGAG